MFDRAFVLYQAQVCTILVGEPVSMFDRVFVLYQAQKHW